MAQHSGTVFDGDTGLQCSRRKGMPQTVEVDVVDFQLSQQPVHMVGDPSGLHDVAISGMKQRCFRILSTLPRHRVQIRLQSLIERLIHRHLAHSAGFCALIDERTADRSVLFIGHHAIQGFIHLDLSFGQADILDT